MSASRIDPAGTTASSADDYPATIVEYSTTNEVENPEMLFLELRVENLRDGGYSAMMFGCPVGASDVRVLMK